MLKHRHAELGRRPWRALPHARWHVYCMPFSTIARTRKRARMHTKSHQNTGCNIVMASMHVHVSVVIKCGCICSSHPDGCPAPPAWQPAEHSPCTCAPFPGACGAPSPCACACPLAAGRCRPACQAHARKGACKSVQCCTSTFLLVHSKEGVRAMHRTIAVRIADITSCQRSDWITLKAVCMEANLRFMHGWLPRAHGPCLGEHLQAPTGRRCVALDMKPAAMQKRNAAAHAAGGDERLERYPAAHAHAPHHTTRPAGRAFGRA